MLLGTCHTLAGQSTPTSKPLAGAIDIHAHCGPDVLPRKVDVIDLARLARAEGMRAIVVKNHYVPTANDAYLTRKVVPGIAVFGGIDLNRTVGGINPAAVENMAHIAGGYGRMVWMTSFDSRAQVEAEKSNRPYVAVTRNSELLPEVKQVIAIIAKYNLVLETSHNYPDEILMMIREANHAGVKHIVVTHAMIAPIHMNIAQMKEAASLGAYIEFVYNGLIGPYKEFSFDDYAKAIHAIGADHAILASDLGQVVNPNHTDGLKLYYAGLLKAGVTQAEIDRMARVNPADVLDLH
ncbi:DUF6282 family protein [Terriglobus sp.]|uniref:DUF6282 family protein n=1 Tax=Terriglobus sp. TaxID=1889013 RepID=UPI003B00A9CA